MKSNPKQKALYLALCILAAVVVWIFVDNFGDNGGPVMHTKWFRDVPITYTGETVLTERGFMLLDEDEMDFLTLDEEIVEEKPETGREADDGKNPTGTERK